MGLRSITGVARELVPPTATATKKKPTSPTISAPPRKNPCRVVRPVSSDACSPQSFIENSEEMYMLKNLHESKTEGRSLYPPNTKMSDFKRCMVIFVHNCASSDDDSFSPNCFFTLGKMGNPNQVLWLFSFHVLGKCTQRYNPGKFKDVDSAVKSIVDKTILSNHMLFGDKHNWCDKSTDNIASYNNLALLTDPIARNFTRDFATRFWMKVVTTVSLFLECMRGMHAGSGSPGRRFSINRTFCMVVISGGTCTTQSEHDSFLFTLDAGKASGRHPTPINDSERGTLLHIRCLSKK